MSMYRYKILLFFKNSIGKKGQPTQGGGGGGGSSIYLIGGQ